MPFHIYLNFKVTNTSLLEEVIYFITHFPTERETSKNSVIAETYKNVQYGKRNCSPRIVCEILIESTFYHKRIGLVILGN